jgi:ATP-dependent Clp protease ATP-binding subunit ClpA
MDNATLTDNNGYKANFQNVILIMTSNIGANARSVMGFNKDSSLAKNEELKLFFTPEFRNRLSAIVEFDQLTIEIIKDIVEKFIVELNTELKKKKITIALSPEAIAFIAKESYSPEMGARPIKRYIQNNITEQLSDEILFGKLKNGGSVNVTFNKKLILKFKELN